VGMGREGKAVVLGPGGAVLVVVVVVVVVMPSHVGMVSAEDARRELREVGDAWRALQAGLVPAGERVPVRVKRVDAPLPINEAVLDRRVAIESFTWTYAALLSRRGQQVLERAKCPTAKAFAWQGRVGDDVPAALRILARQAQFFLEHPSAPVAWGFVTELDELARSTRWASREVAATAKRVSIGVACREPECKGVYAIEVQDEEGEGSDADRKRAFGAKGPVAVCSVDDSHVMGGRDAAR